MFIYLENGVEIVTSSDAHRPEDVGKFILEANDIIRKFKDAIWYFKIKGDVL